VPCRVSRSPEGVVLELAEDFHGAAPGQAAQLLRGDVIVGWATIAR
jgi:tRNA-specific 2-thiouridylase